MVEIADKPTPPPIPTFADPFKKPTGRSRGKTLENLMLSEPKSPKNKRKTLEGLMPTRTYANSRKTLEAPIPVITPTTPTFPESPNFIEKGANFIPLDVPGKGPGHRMLGMKRRTLILLWVFGILLILGLSLGLGLGLGLKGLQPQDKGAPTTASTVPAASSFAAIISATPTVSTNGPATTTSTPTSTANPAGRVVKAQVFNQPAFAVPASATTTTYTVAAATATSGVGMVNCPSSNNSVYTSGSASKKFQISCYTDFPGPGVLNLDAIIVNSLDACMDACASYTGSNGNCSAVSYSADLTTMVPQQKANCWLKDGSGAPVAGVWDQASAVLVEA